MPLCFPLNASVAEVVSTAAEYLLDETTTDAFLTSTLYGVLEDDARLIDLGLVDDEALDLHSSSASANSHRTVVQVAAARGIGTMSCYGDPLMMRSVALQSGEDPQVFTPTDEREPLPFVDPRGGSAMASVVLPPPIMETVIGLSDSDLLALQSLSDHEPEPEPEPESESESEPEAETTGLRAGVITSDELLLSVLVSAGPNSPDSGRQARHFLATCIWLPRGSGLRSNQTIERLEVLLGEAPSDSARAELQAQVSRLLHMWLEEAPSDFERKRLLLQGARELDQAYALGLEGSIKAALSHAREQAWSAPRNPVFTGRSVPRKARDVSAKVLAQQLTARDIATMRRITASELVMRARGKDVGLSTVALSVTEFNSLARWVVTSIVMPKRAKNRAKVIVHLIDVVVELIHLRNYNSAMAIIAGFNSCEVSRLSQTWALITGLHAEQLSIFTVLFSTHGNFKMLRDTVSSCSRPCVPYLGIILTDVVKAVQRSELVEPPEGTVDWGMWDFVLTQTQSFLDAVVERPSATYATSIDPCIAAFIASFTGLSEKEAYTLSCKREKRRGN